MSIKPVIQDKTEEILSRKAESYQVTPTALAKAIIHTVCQEGIIHETLAGVDVSQFQIRKGRKKGGGQYLYQGKHRSLSAISEMTGIPYDTLHSRLERGWDFERAVSVPKMKRGFPKRGDAA